MSGLILRAMVMAGFVVSTAGASELRDISPITDRVLMLHFVDGKAWWGAAGDGENGGVDVRPLDCAAAGHPEAYAISSKEDGAFAATVHPEQVGRKSKGRDFTMDHGTCRWVMEHWVFLQLPQPLQQGKTYTIELGAIGSDTTTGSFTFDASQSRSETIHVNQIGYVPTAPEKYAYLSAWMGDLGSLPLDAYANVQFHVIDTQTGKSVFSGKPTLRKRGTEADGGQPDDAAGTHGNHIGADLWQCDFSAVQKPGEYIISVDRIGCSFPFQIGNDVYRQAFVATARALYHQRCGTELKQPYTTWVRPACHRGSDAHPIRVTSDTYLEHSHSDGDPDADKKLTGEVRNDCWGGYHDAGDWDRESWHPDVANQLLLAYELSPGHFRDGELNIPESGNGIPDIIDEAQWGVDYYRRIQRADGAVSAGIYEQGCPQQGIPSWADSMKWYMYADDPAATYRYAAVACRLAWCLELAGNGELGKPYTASAIKAWDWAQGHTKPELDAKVRDERFHAAAALYRVTGEAKYQDAFKRDLKIDNPTAPLFLWEQWDQKWGVWTYILTDRPGVDRELRDRLRQAAVYYADTSTVQTAARRGGRYGYDWWIPLAWGRATNPQTVPLLVAHHLTGDAKFLAPQYTTCDYMLGGNPLNMVWVTGLGERSPEQVMHWDSWYNPAMKGKPVPGIVPMGPHRYSREAAGTWLPGYAQKTCYPDASTWPPHEIWFEDRLCPPTNEFTVGNVAQAAAAYGYLCADAR